MEADKIAEEVGKSARVVGVVDEVAGIFPAGVAAEMVGMITEVAVYAEAAGMSAGVVGILDEEAAVGLGRDMFGEGRIGAAGFGVNSAEG